MKLGYFFTLFPALTRSSGMFFLKSMTFVVIHPNYGVILFDTGTPSNPEELLRSLKHYFDINMEDVKWIFNTHIHPDHVGGNFLFKKAKLVFSKKDLMSYLHTNCPGYKNSFDDFETESMKFYIKNYWKEEKIGIKSNPSFIEDNPEIPPFIKIIPSFGHTFFHYAFKIETRTQNLYVTGDAVSTRLTMNGNKEIRLMEPHMDFDLYFATLDKFQNIDGIFIPGHDRPFYSVTKERIKKNIFEIE